MRAHGRSYRFLAAAAVALLHAGCSAPDERFDIVYDSRFGDATKMDFYLPESSSGARPAVLLIHGGGWSGGSKDNMQVVARRLARSGYVAASIDYRLVPDGAFPNAVKDCWCAFAFFRSQASELGFDPDRVAVMGYSAGGHLVGMLGVTADVPELAPDCAAGMTGPPQGVISGAGVMDMTSYDDQDAIVNFMNGKEAEHLDDYHLASPVHHVAQGAPPFLFVHGGGDWFVSLDNSEQMRDKLVAVGSDARLITIGGGGHLLNPGPDAASFYLEVSTDLPEVWLAIEDFLARTIGEP
jgi:acetyl esterase/lipase